jgi:hypothetical protein
MNTDLDIFAAALATGLVLNDIADAEFEAAQIERRERRRAQPFDPDRGTSPTESDDLV